jgi:hypothetical protein
MAIELIDKIKPKNDGFTGMVDANQVLGGGASGTLPDACVAESNVTQHVTTNATHTGEVTGSGVLTVDSTAITNKDEVTAVGSDYVLISDTSDSGNLKKALVSDFANSGDAVSLRGVDLDSSVGTPSDGKILVYRSAGTDWVLEDKPISGSNPAINDISDIDITSVGDNEVLAYDSSSGSWINQTAAEAGLATDSHNHDDSYSAIGHTHIAGSITDFEDAVNAAGSVVANTAHITSDGTDHTYINQDVRTTAAPSFNHIYINGVNPRINITSTATGNQWYLQELDVGSDFRLYEQGSANEVMRFQHLTGYVGINNTNPTTELDVTGTITTDSLTIVNTINEISTDGTLSGSSNSAVPTEAAIKQYVDDTTQSQDTLQEIATNGNTYTGSLELNAIKVASGVGINEFSTDGTLSGSSNTTLSTEAAVKQYVDDGLAGLEVSRIYEGDSEIEVIDSGTGSIMLRVDGGDVARFNASGLKLATGATVNDISTDGTLSGSSNTSLVTQAAVKQYVDDNSGGSGDVTKVGTPSDNQIGVWTGDGTIEGDSNFTWNGNDLDITGSITISGTIDGVDLSAKATVWDAKMDDVVDDTTPQLGGNLDLNAKGFTEEFTAGEVVSAGELCCLDQYGNFVKADASSEATSKSMLVVATETIGSASTGTFLVKGQYTVPGGSLTVGSPYFISDTAGTATDTALTATGSFVRIIGYALTSGTIFFDPDKTYIEN